MMGVRARPELNGVRARAPLTAARLSSLPIFANFCALGFRPRAALLTRCYNTAPRAPGSSRRARAAPSGVAREHAQIARAGCACDGADGARAWGCGARAGAGAAAAPPRSAADGAVPDPRSDVQSNIPGSYEVESGILETSAAFCRGLSETERRRPECCPSSCHSVLLASQGPSLSQEQLISTGSIWEACEQISHLPQDNHAAVLSAMAAYLGVVRDAVEEMEQAQGEDQDPYSDIMEDEELGSRGNRDTYWSEADRKLLGPCMGLMKASKACLKKLLGTVKVHGKADTPEQVAQLDDLADITNEISPSIDELALSMYPPMNQLAVRLNAAKLASVLKKVLEITKASHVCHPSEENWVQFLTGAVDHNMDKIKDFTQSEL
ncbi:cyclin-D1-binding protein 1 isoform X2 [Dermochelys coriacea]|uniref:cyclin-D1-binding protein 1 isoform X2 n=1 Tax=Dermochelys coriacea TaxID=27794 RepID=UPI001CA83B4E|nr:cyclin-D1-binding protein 1 isoform X2 [Dermochelys coriacea]